MTTDTQPPEQTPEGEAAPAKPAPRPKAGQEAPKRPGRQRQTVKKGDQSPYDQGYRAGNRVWPD